MSLTWKPGEAHWCYYSCVRLPAFRAHHNQTVVGGVGRAVRMVNSLAELVMQWDQKKGRPGEGETSGRGHTLVDVRGNICAKQQRVAPSPACQPRRLGPVAPSGVGLGEGGVVQFGHKVLLASACSGLHLRQMFGGHTEYPHKCCYEWPMWVKNSNVSVTKENANNNTHRRFVCVVVFCCVFWITLMLIVFIVLIL